MCPLSTNQQRRQRGPMKPPGTLRSRSQPSQSGRPSCRQDTRRRLSSVATPAAAQWLVGEGLARRPGPPYRFPHSPQAPPADISEPRLCAWNVTGVVSSQAGLTLHFSDKEAEDQRMSCLPRHRAVLGEAVCEVCLGGGLVQHCKSASCQGTPPPPPRAGGHPSV